MKFIKLESRGGNYLVVAENVAWLRTAENGQTTVGIVGGQPLLVVGSIEEVAAKILAGSAPEDEQVVAEPQAATPAASVESAPAPTTAAETAQQNVLLSVERHNDEVNPARLLATLLTREPVAARQPVQPMPEGQQLIRTQPVSLADRVARAAAPKVKAETQRFMGLAE